MVASIHDQFLVAFGKNGIVGAFTLGEPMPLRRGQRVVLETDRGIELGAILRPATLTQARIFGAAAAGQIVRIATEHDERLARTQTEHADAIFTAARRDAQATGLHLEILDIEVLLDGQSAIVQFVGEEAGTERLAEALGSQFALRVRFENLAIPANPEPEPAQCDKPDCGKDAGGCSTCSTGGGCSSCGSAKTDISPYFAHLRKNMEADRRIPLA